MLLLVAATYAAPLDEVVTHLHDGGPHEVAGAVIRWGGVERAFAGGADADTVFELGSLTKTYSALLVADAAQRGELSLDQPVAELMPDGWFFDGGPPVTVADLASHHAWLPRLPPNMGLWYVLTHRRDPYATYDERKLHEAVLFTRPWQGGYKYSNYGPGLLGYLVAHQADSTWLPLLEGRVLAPLALHDTREATDAQITQGHNPRGKPVDPWHFDVLAPAGSLDSDLDDQIRWVQAWLDPDATKLGDAMHAALETQNTWEGGEVALGWHINVDGGRRLYWHNGGTAGFSTFAGFDPIAGVGVVLLSSRSQNEALTAAGLELLAEAPAGSPHAVDSLALQTFVEDSEHTGTTSWMLSRHGELVASWPDLASQPALDTMSVTKSIAALGVGLLLRDGHLEGLDVPVVDVVPAWADALSARLTVRHLLTHTTGLAAEAPSADLYAAEDVVAHALAAERVAPPGARFAYNNDASNLVPALIEAAAGETFLAYMQRELFDPLGLPRITWQTDASGHVLGFAGAELRARDLLRLGELIAADGAWRGERLLPSSFVAELGVPYRGGYGLQWWAVLDDEGCGITEAQLAGWAAEGVDPELIARLEPYAGKPADKEAFFEMVDEVMEGDRDAWADLTSKAGRRDCETLGTPIGLRADGYLGQAIVILPASGLVAVRQVAWAEDVDPDAVAWPELVARVRGLAEVDADEAPADP